MVQKHTHTHRHIVKMGHHTFIILFSLTLFPLLTTSTRVSPLLTTSTRGSPVVTAATPAILTYNDFSRGSPCECDGQYYDENQRVVALSTGWYNRGSRCGQMITISGNGRTSTAMVVDECDSRKRSGGQPPCKDNIVNASEAVWGDLQIRLVLGEVDVTWSMA